MPWGICNRPCVEALYSTGNYNYSPIATTKFPLISLLFSQLSGFWLKTQELFNFHPPLSHCGIQETSTYSSVFIRHFIPLTSRRFPPIIYTFKAKSSSFRMAGFKCKITLLLSFPHSYICPFKVLLDKTLSWKYPDPIVKHRIGPSAHVRTRQFHMNFTVTIIGITLLLRDFLWSRFCRQFQIWHQCKPTEFFRNSLIYYASWREKKKAWDSGNPVTCRQSVKRLKLRGKTVIPGNFRVDDFGEDKLYAETCIGTNSYSRKSD